MTSEAQLPLALEQRPAYGRSDFLVSDSNRNALAWVDAWPEWPGHALVLCGPEGCGKTHLAHVWRALSGAGMLQTRPISPEAVGGGHLVIEGVDETEADVGLFHTLNRAKDAGVDILLTSRVAPGRWRGRLPDLVSRLRSATTVNIGQPDDALIATVLTKLLRDRQLGAGEDVIAYLVRHMERSFKAAQRTVAAADALALAEHRRITVPLVRRVLEL